jgi:hypothetical protein
MKALRIAAVFGALASAATDAQTPTIAAQAAPDGTLTALRIQVSKDGPPQ